MNDLSSGRDQKVAIVGAGTGGLAATHCLLKENPDLEVAALEERDFIGGRIGRDEVEGFIIDRAASLFLASYDSVKSIAADLNLPLHTPTFKKAGLVYNNGKFHTMSPFGSIWDKLHTLKALAFGLGTPKSLMQFARFRNHLNSLKDSLSINDSRLLLHLDAHASFTEYMKANGMADCLRDFLRNDLRGYTGGSPDQMSPAVAMTMLWNFSINTGPESDVQLPSRGVSELCTALTDRYRDHIRISTAVEEIVIDNSQVKGVRTTTGETIEADAVICCAPASRIPAMLRNGPSSIPDVLSKVTSEPCIKMAMGLDVELLPAFAYAAVFKEEVDTMLTAVENNRLITPDSVPDGKFMYHVLVMADYARELFKLDDEEIAKRIVDEIRRFWPKMDGVEPIFTRVYRWAETGCLVPGKVLTEIHDMLDNEVPKVHGLFFAGGWINSPSVNGVMSSSIKAANDCLTYLGRTG